METTFQIVSDLSDVRDVWTVGRFVFVFRKLEIDFFSEEIFEEEVHEFRVFFLFKVVVAEHHDTAADDEFSSAFVVMVDGTDGSVAGVGERA